jgi:hypothetical protein
VDGETSSIECAHQLGKLCESRHLVVNLIPYNATDVKDVLQCPSNDHMQKFRDIVASYGTFCTIRRTMGADIASACGQLVQNKTNQEEASPKEAVDIEDVVSGGTNQRTRDQTATSANPTTRSTTSAEAKAATAEKATPTSGSLSSWMDSISTEGLELWTNRLAIATAVSASCFLVSSALFLRKR